MFDNFNMDDMNVNMKAVLALYASARTTGTVMDSGDDVSQVVPVCEGNNLPNAASVWTWGAASSTTTL